MKLSRTKYPVLVMLCLCCALFVPAKHSDARAFVDCAGRSVAVADRIGRVFAAGPPAAIILYTLAPDKLVGWNRDLSVAEREYLAPAYRDLPVVGRLTGRGGTANVEVVLNSGADMIIDYGSIKPTFRSLADRVQAKTRVPYVLIDGAFENIPRSYRLLGELLNEQARAERLARYAETLMTRVASVVARRQNSPPRVYYGRGVDGLETGARGAINIELLDVVAARNVAADASRRRGLFTASMEQVLAWDPEIVLTLDPHFFANVYDNPTWRPIESLRQRRVYLAPQLPFGWFDRPPSVNRLIGVQWLLSILYPQAPGFDLREATREFYELFYHLPLDDAALDRLLGTSL